MFLLILLPLLFTLLMLVEYLDLGIDLRIYYIGLMRKLYLLLLGI